MKRYSLSREKLRKEYEIIKRKLLHPAYKAIFDTVREEAGVDENYRKINMSGVSNDDAKAYWDEIAKHTRERGFLVLQMRLGKCHGEYQQTFVEIGNQLSISPGRAMQIMSSELRKLKHKRNSRCMTLLKKVTGRKHLDKLIVCDKDGIRSFCRLQKARQGN